MINTIKSFFAYARMVVFANLIEWEIYQRMFPHLQQEKDSGYPFQSAEELREMLTRSQRDAKACLEIIERQADEMGKAYGEAFRFIMYRNLNRRLLPYMKLAQHRVPPRLRVAKYAH